MSQRRPLRKEEIAEYKEAFDIFDMYSEGTIDLKDLQPIMRYLNFDFSTKQIIEMLNSIEGLVELDEEFNGKIDFGMFVCFMTSVSIDPEEELRTVFGIFDVDNSGSISKDEFVSIMLQLGQNLTEAEIDDMIEAVDENNDGEISFEEFKNMMNNCSSE